MDDKHIWRKISKYLAFVPASGVALYNMGMATGHLKGVRVEGIGDYITATIFVVITYFVSKHVFTFLHIYGTIAAIWIAVGLIRG